MALALAGGLHAQEKHLTLDDIDQLARQKIVDSMKKAPDGNASQQAAPMLGASLPATPAPAQAAAEAPKPAPRRAVAPVVHAVPVTFLGAFSDSTGSYVLYDYMGAIYPGRQGTKLLNGWTVSRIDGYQVTVTEGNCAWNTVTMRGANQMWVCNKWGNWVPISNLVGNFTTVQKLSGYANGWQIAVPVCGPGGSPWYEIIPQSVSTDYANHNPPLAGNRFVMGSAGSNWMLQIFNVLADGANSLVGDQLGLQAEVDTGCSFGNE
jgi:hypothetical protein